MQKLLIGRVGAVADHQVHRVLADRLWPRGVSKVGAPWDTWMKELAPSTELRKWYGHDPQRYSEFRQRYWLELEQLREEPAMERLLRIWTEEPVMLVTATKNLDVSHIPVLRDFLVHIATSI